MKDAFHLVTSSLEETWDFNKKNLFAGEWCKLYSRRTSWKKLNYLTLNYHWNDRIKYYKDSKYLRIIFKECVKILTTSLNQFHKKNYSQRYWQILIGPWLHKFINILYDKFFTIKLISNEYKVDSSYIIDFNKSFFVPKDTFEFNTLMLNDSWNHLIFSELQEYFFNIPYKKISFSGNYKEINKKFINYSDNETIKVKFLKLIDKLSKNLLIKNHKYLIKMSGLSFYDELKLNFLLNKFPTFDYEVLSIETDFDEKIRSKFEIKNYDLKTDDFFKIVIFMIKRHIPLAFIEGFDLINKKIERENLPKRPEKIFTSNSFEYDEIFKFYTAEKTEKGTKLIIGQHGGFYGVSKWNHGEEHLLDIADKFISWGWKSDNQKVYPGFNFSPSLYKRNSQTTDSKGIFLTHPVARHNWKTQSWPASAYQSNSYMDDHIKFFKNLDKEIRKKIVYRILISSDVENKTSFIEKMNNNFSEIEIDKGKKPLKKILKKYKIACIPYNATNLLQTLKSNYPTIIFWNEDYFELRDDAIHYFEKLKEVNIFHSSPISAAKHLNFIWEDIDSWWDNEKTQNARKTFCLKYSQLKKHNIHSMKKIIQNI